MSTEEVFLFIGKISEYVQNNLISNGRIDVTGLIVVVRDMVVLIIQSSLLSIVISFDNLCYQSIYFTFSKE